MTFKKGIHRIGLYVLFALFLAKTGVAQQPGRLTVLVDETSGLEDFTRPVVSPKGDALYFVNTKNELHTSVVLQKPTGDSFSPPRPDVNLCPNHSGFVYQVMDKQNALIHDDDLHFEEDHPALVYMSKEPFGFDREQAVNIWKYSNEAKSYPDFNLSRDKKALFMALDNDQSKGGTDIFVSIRGAGRHFQEPVSLGNGLNTKGMEMTPFISPDGQYLYFSSDGREGSQGQDVYFCKRLDESYLNWSEPQALEAVNTEGFEAYYTCTEDRKIGYFLRVEQSGWFKKKSQIMEVSFKKQHAQGDPATDQDRSINQ